MVGFQRLRGRWEAALQLATTPSRRAPPEHMGRVPAARAGPRGDAEAMAPGSAHPPDAAKAPKHLSILQAHATWS